jgi:hypothetical protein
LLGVRCARAAGRAHAGLRGTWLASPAATTSSASALPRFERQPARWEWDDVSWGVQPCYRCHFARPAEILVLGEPLCIPCTELLVERYVAISESPELVHTLPPLWES